MNCSTSSSVCPFICVLVDGFDLLLLTRILLLSELIPMPYSAADSAAVSCSDRVSCCSSSSLLSIGSMSSANRKLQNDRPQMATDDSGWSVASAPSTASSAKQSFTDELTGVGTFCSVFSRKILNNTVDNGHPSRTPTVVGKKSSAFPLSSTPLVASPYNGLVTSICQLSMLYSFKTRQRRKLTSRT